uniref:Uncharacterized protein n=1 Tax=Spongospora subterranea TaxID=70186 RepID=A0A0H5QSS6_9EUKA|eukprot:CRZ04737.1 hypothetical protein [Spongospora subterranea]
MAGKKKKSGAKKKGGDDSGGAGERESAPDQFDQMDSDQLKMAIVDMTSRLKDIKNQRVSQQIERVLTWHFTFRCPDKSYILKCLKGSSSPLVFRIHVASLVQIHTKFRLFSKDKHVC